MTMNDRVLDVIDGFGETLALLTNEIGFGLMVAFGMILWIVTGRRVDHHSQPRH